MTLSFVVDSSAVLALIEGEEGADRVEQVLLGGRALLPWPVLMEVHYIALQECGPAVAESRYAMLLASGAEVLWGMDEATFFTASRLKAAHRLSFADSVSAAVALLKGATLLHKDPEFDSLGPDLTREALPYRRGR